MSSTQSELRSALVGPSPRRIDPPYDLPTADDAHVPSLDAAPGRPAVDAESGAAWARRYRRRLRLVDTAVLAASIVGAVAVDATRAIAAGRGTDASTLAESVGSPWLPVVVGLVWTACLTLHRTRDLAVVGSGVVEYKRLLTASVWAFAVVAIGFASVGHIGGEGYFLVALPVGGAGLVTGRWTMRRWLERQRSKGHYLSRAVVVGSRDDIADVVRRIDKTSGAVYDIVGAAVPDSDPRGIVVGGRVVPVVADLDGVPRAVWRLGAESVIVAGEPGRGREYLRDLGWSLEGRATELVIASRLTNVAGPRIHYRPVEGLPLMHVELPQFDGPRHALKRLSDLVLASAALVVLWPVFALVALAVRLDGPGPVLFRQRRVGRDGRTFEMLKFRSMVVDAESRLSDLAQADEGAGLLFKMKADPRVTRVGAVLRRWSLDELPQLLNILRGDMSVVGPRPPLPREVEGYEDHVHRRLYIKPGLTGMWQVNGRSDLSWEESVRLDLYYVENWSLTVDFVIMWRTVRVLFEHRGAY
ncbi:sugar transferase [Frigoribacterium sp. VKM Ac-1396]|uniref:sugar transferase n=1 Tax=Frigoribacterium sp. VKM Ac-1396 TaxID=2783821 RepID=UPI00188D7740|nr:sugar transferase [Frigoribacterium sp. VKM Ac-1396]MBF4599475.1 sugar transferase [Frigoribacterium sp. VKM Ac-1396]